ncbi:hypothetical protein [Methanoculleus oceani]|uniref:carboxylate--amine ligase n=1 Tax=Methanoculleus oceani TaxID=2184756 RepID=UPI0020346AF2|nr:hypothetical protein [Methanoculleus sp. CWC-02]
MKKDKCVLVLGGYINSYSIIQELYEKHVIEIILLDTTRSVASYSNKIKKFVLIENSPDALRDEIQKLHEDYDYIVIFPTNDLHLEYLHQVYADISSYCFMPFNYNNLLQCLDKYTQYEHCEQLNVPYPKTMCINSIEDLDKMSTLKYPVIIKPRKRDDISTDVFRNLQLQTKLDLEAYSVYIEKYLAKGITFLASEIIPGDGSNIYAYVGYRSKDGKILNEWTGKKLSQYPDDFGVFASASNEAPEEVLHQGRTLLNGMDLIGIAEPEFKFDPRDGKYKLMEINLRSMMWHRVGNLSGVNIQYSQYLDAIGENVEKQIQERTRKIHFVYLKHEIVNLIKRKGYYRTAYYNLFKSDKTFIAFFDPWDLWPFLKDTIFAIKRMVEICLKALRCI